jgi:hypothetical protein
MPVRVAIYSQTSFSRILTVRINLNLLAGFRFGRVCIRALAFTLLLAHGSERCALLPSVERQQQAWFRGYGISHLLEPRRQGLREGRVRVMHRENVCFAFLCHDFEVGQLWRLAWSVPIVCDSWWGWLSTLSALSARIGAYVPTYTGLYYTQDYQDSRA